MSAYVEEYGNTSLCAVSTGAGCSEKEKIYITKAKAMSQEDVQAQIQRLEKMEDSDMKPDLKKWIVKRKKILNQFVVSDSDEL